MGLHVTAEQAGAVNEEEVWIATRLSTPQASRGHVTGTEDYGHYPDDGHAADEDNLNHFDQLLCSLESA